MFNYKFMNDEVNMNDTVDWHKNMLIVIDDKKSYVHTCVGDNFSIIISEDGEIITVQKNVIHVLDVIALIAPPSSITACHAYDIDINSIDVTFTIKKYGVMR